MPQPTPLANALAQYAPPKQTPSTPLANALMEYAARVKGDFQHGLDESAQGFGEMVNGQFATGAPRTFLGGLGWMGSPVSGAVSPLLNPIMQPVAQGVHDYVGQPLESATGYPADLTTELALALALPKALHGAGKAVNSAVPYLASLGDAVGKHIGVPEGSYLSGPHFKAPNSTVSSIVDGGDTWYHGSPADIYGADGSGKFRLTAGETGVPAVWASKDPFTAEGYSRGEIALNYDDAAGKFPLTKSWYKDWDGKGGVYGLKSTAKNPLISDAEGKQWSSVQQGKIMREAKAKGHDAVIFKNIADNYQPGGTTSDVIAFIDENAFAPDRKSPISSPVGGGTDPRGGIPLDVLNNRAKAASLRLKLDPLEASLKKALLAKDVEQASKIREKLKGLRGQISSLDPS